MQNKFTVITPPKIHTVCVCFYFALAQQKKVLGTLTIMCSLRCNDIICTAASSATPLPCRGTEEPILANKQYRNQIQVVFSKSAHRAPFKMCSKHKKYWVRYVTPDSLNICPCPCPGGLYGQRVVYVLGSLMHAGPPKGRELLWQPKVGGGVHMVLCLFDTPSPNTIVFSVLHHPVAHYGGILRSLPYAMVAQ